MLSHGVGPVDCLNPTAMSPAGLSAVLLCSPRVHGPTDEFSLGNFDLLTRGGALSPLFRFSYLAAARAPLGERRFRELRSLLVSGSTLAPVQLAIVRALRSEAAQTADPVQRAKLEGMADALIAGTFDELLPEIAAALTPQDRLPELLAPEFLAFLSVRTADRVFGIYWGVPSVRDTPSLSGVGSSQLTLSSTPFWVGPDGVRNNADDLPTLLSSGAGLLSVGPTGPPFPSSEFEDVVSVLPSSGPPAVEFYGRFRSEIPVLVGCPLIGGTPGFDSGTCRDMAGGDLTETALAAGCRLLTSNGQAGGINASGRCILLVFGLTTVPFAALDPLADPRVRPAVARMEPFDLTDLVLAGSTGGLTPPARPRSPVGSLHFADSCPALGSRRIDPKTGAPVRASGPLSCKRRTALVGGATLAVGPDAIPGTADDILPSVGNCLLWDNPASPSASQKLRDPREVAADHPAQQTLFHTLCTVQFDAFQETCPLDQLNHPTFFPFVSSAPVGKRVIGGLAIDGVSRIRVELSPFSNQIPNAKLSDLVFRSTARTGTSQDLGNLTVEQ
ncbi:MAG: hypothetical protein ACE5FG_14170 [Myxococcota bacterium]